MKQLSGADSMFLQLEHGNNFMHVASLAIYDPSTAPGGGVRFKDVLRFFASRLEQFPQFRRRLVTVPLSLDRPYWLEDSSFDVEFHVRHIALPHPGDWRQLCIQVARIHSRPLDRSKPLWEAYVIEGLHNIPGVPPGSFALYSKMHHAIVDGESGTEIMRALHSLSPEPIDPEPEEDGRYHMDRDPTALELYSRALIHNMENVPALARFSFGTARRLATLGVGALGKMAADASAQMPSIRSILSGDLTGLLPKMPPQTRFSGDVSAHRIFEAVGLPLADFRVVRNCIPEATINDQFLAIVGGALREYLESKNELPDATMVAGVPLTLRGAEKGGDRGNQVGFTLMPVHTEIEDPLERLKAISADSIKAKRMTDAIGKELARDLLDHLPNFVSGALLRNVRMPRIGLIVSNVRGPDVPLYMAGARLVNYAPVSIPIDGLGLNVTGFSYAGTMWICAISCRDMLPDPGFFADCMRRSFARLKEAAQGGVAHAHAPKLLPGRPKRAAAKRTKAGRPAKRRAVRKAASRR